MKNRKLILLLILTAAIIFFGKGLFIVATVNGRPISRLSIIKDLESKVGKQVLESFINNQLIRQEAAKRNVKVTKEEKEKKIKEIDSSASKQGQKLDQLLSMQGITRKDFEDQVEIQLILEKMLTDKIKISDKEIDTQIKAMTAVNPDSLEVALSPTPTPPDRNEIRTQLRQQKLQTEAGKLVEDLKKNAKISYFVKY